MSPRSVAWLASLLAAAGCSGPPPGAAGRPEAGVALGTGAAPHVIDLGRVPAGSSHSRRVRLANGTPRPIRIDGFEATCGCTTVEGLPVEVPAGGAAEVTIATDLAKEPDFAGGLTIAVEFRSGATPRGSAAVSCVVAGPGDAPR